MNLVKKMTAVVAVVLWSAGGAAADTNCPSGTYRMIRGYGGEVICVPYGQGSPSQPAPKTRPSDISGTDGSRSTGSGSSGTVRSAQ